MLTVWKPAAPLAQTGKDKNLYSDEIPEAFAHDEDVHLMLRVKHGDDEAFGLLVDKHKQTVMNLVYRFTSDRNHAEDLAQEVFLRIYRAAPRFQVKAKFFTYLYKITLNLCRNHRDKMKRKKTYSLDSSFYDNDHIEGPKRQIEDLKSGTDETIARIELGEVVREAVLQLPEEQRQAVILQRFEHLSYEEISHTLGISVAAVKSRVHRAKLSLQKALAPYTFMNTQQEKSHEK